MHFMKNVRKEKLGTLILSFLPDHDNGLKKWCIFDMILDFSTKTNNHGYENFKSMCL